MFKHAELIQSVGGIVEGNKVRKFGVGIVGKTKSTLNDETKNVIKLTNEELALEELNGKITYLSDSTKENYNEYILNDLGHNTAHGNYISILVSGVKQSTVLELVSNKNFKCSRLTTSRTSAQNEQLYSASNPKYDAFIDSFVELRNSFLFENTELDLEEQNELSLELKALSLVIHVELYQLYKYCYKKLNNPYEYELKEVCKEILNVIKDEPLIKVLNQK